MLAELDYVDEEMPDADEFASIEGSHAAGRRLRVPGAGRREMTDAMANALRNVRTALVAGGRLIDPATPEVLAFVEEVLETG